MNEKHTRNLFFYLLAAAVIGGMVGASFASAPAEANLFTDFFRSFGQGRNATATVEQAPAAPLYKPAIDFEQAVVAAVGKASPAVVAITISKNVPVIERCPYNPFGDLPPEFQEFFGGGFEGFYQPCERGSELREVGSGSGFIVSQSGLIVTNRHVVSDTAASYTVFTNDGKKYDARVVARDPAQDLAIVKIEASNLPAVALGDSDSIQLGQTAIAIGNALGEFRNTVSVGVVSGLARDVTASGGGGVERIEGVIQTDAAINQGNSGGPLLNLRGEVIGINTAVVSGAQNIGFAIPVNKAKRDIRSVEQTGEIRVPYLGVRYITITPEFAKKEKLPVEAGALVRGSEDGPAVELNSPAAKAGVQAEDIIRAVGGKHIAASRSLGSIIAELAIGETVSLNVSRGGKDITLQVTVGRRPQ